MDAVIVGIDLSGEERLVTRRKLRAPSQVALEKAAWIAAHYEVPLRVITSFDIDAQAESRIRQDFERGVGVLQLAQDRLGDITAGIADSGIDVSAQVAFGSASDAILVEISSWEHPLVVVGTRDRSTLARNLLGSLALSLLRRAKAPVWVARTGPQDDWHKTLAFVDLDEMTKRVVRYAAEAATVLETELHVAHVIEYSGERVLRAGDADDEAIRSYRASRRSHAEAEFAALVDAALHEGQEVQLHLIDGDATEQIPLITKNIDPDVVIMGTPVHGRIQGLLLGDTCEKVLPLLETSLLVVRPRPEGSNDMTMAL